VLYPSNYLSQRNNFGVILYISKETIERVRERSNIEDIIAKYVPTLTKKGINYVGLCPFHKEKTPSFSVNPAKQMFYCFGCHTGGNVFTFISKIEGISFPESVKFLAQMVGVEVEQEKSETLDKLVEYFKINSYAKNIYKKLLHSPKGKDGIEYITNRGISKEFIDQFELGYAPEEWTLLTDKLKSVGASLDVSEYLGLITVSKKNKNHFYDKFRNRIIFPIFDERNRVVAFGGRIITDGNPKYLNSPESEIFKKRNILYGLNFAAKEIRDLKRAIVVEGYLDVIACHQFGLKNVVAPLGTALTEKQIKLLSRYTDEIILLFDSDAAGINASLKSLNLEKNINVKIKVALLQNGDPLDFLLKKDYRELMVIIDNALSPVDFKIKKILSSLQEDNRSEVIYKLFQIIGDLDLKSEQEHYVGKISEELELNKNLLLMDFYSYKKNNTITIKKIRQDDNKADFITNKNRELIKLLCKYPALFEKAFIDFADSDFEDEFSKQMFKKFTIIYEKEGIVSNDKFFDFFSDYEEVNFISKAINDTPEIEDPGIAYTENYLNMKLYEIDKKITYYSKKIIQKDVASSEYLTELELLRREKEKLSNYLYNREATNKL